MTRLPSTIRHFPPKTTIFTVVIVGTPSTDSILHKAETPVRKIHATLPLAFGIFCFPLQHMEEYLIISNANFLLRVASEQIAYVCSEGSYDHQTHIST